MNDTGPADKGPHEPWANLAGGRVPRRPLRRIILQNTAALPTLMTLLNGIAGFAAIFYAAKLGLEPVLPPDLPASAAAALIEQWQAKALHYHTIAAWLIFAAMLCDALDGRLARMTRQATDFGAQLDSLCDAISFGVAPAMLMVYAVSITRQVPDFDILLPHSSVLGKAVMAVAIIYMCCAVLRLARFNIENAPDVLSHLSFKGLPSPGAAATVAAMVLLLNHMQHLVLDEGQRHPNQWISITVGVALPAVTLGVALLMVSRLRFPHLVNQFIMGRRPFSYIYKAILVLLAAILFPQLTLALVTVGYAASGPVGWLWRRFAPARTGHRPPTPAGHASHGGTPSAGT